ncbi:hypothetical protein J6590_084964 [Homalodisca vitripennis]|nr:hypothetical protein J6590_084964 [Homalodisca vitripennis]
MNNSWRVNDRKTKQGDACLDAKLALALKSETSFIVATARREMKVALLRFLRGVLIGSIDDAETLALVLWHVRGCVALASSHLSASITLYNSVSDEVDVTWSLTRFRRHCVVALNDTN